MSRPRVPASILASGARRAGASARQCRCCGTTKTSYWRSSGTLCNACGLRHYVESPTPSNERTCYTLLYTCRPVWVCSRGQPGQIQHPSAVFRRVGKYVIEHNVALFGAWEEGSGRGPETGGDIEVRDRPRLVRVGARMDWGFETTAFEPQTYLVGPGRVDFGTFLCFVSGTSGNAYATPTEAPLLKSGVPDTPTQHPLS